MPQPSDAALAQLSQKVYVPAFFEKLASEYDVRPRNRAEAEQLLAIGSQVMSLPADRFEKVATVQPAAAPAGEANPFLAAAYANLAGPDALIKQAADVAVAQDADLLAAALEVATATAAPAA
jgi:hypothetical protein